jgi:hypothetical protein
MLSWNDEAPALVTPGERKRLEEKEREEAREREREQRFDLWGLTRHERRLFRALEGQPILTNQEDGSVWRCPATKDDLVGKIYGIRLCKKTDKETKQRYYARLQRLQSRLNDKLRLARVGLKVKPWTKAHLGLVDEEAAPPAPGRASFMTVETCMQRLETILAKHTIPQREVERQLASEGCRPGTLKRASKQLRVVRTRQGYGAGGKWLMGLRG